PVTRQTFPCMRFPLRSAATPQPPEDETKPGIVKEKSEIMFTFVWHAEFWRPRATPEQALRGRGSGGRDRAARASRPRPRGAVRRWAGGRHARRRPRGPRFGSRAPPPPDWRRRR